MPALHCISNTSQKFSPKEKQERGRERTGKGEKGRRERERLEGEKKMLFFKGRRKDTLHWRSRCTRSPGNTTCGGGAKGKEERRHVTYAVEFFSF